MVMLTAEEFYGSDSNPNNVFAAVGRALTAWEMMEHGFSLLYTIFQGRPAKGRWVRDSDKLTEYGMTLGGFDGRMEALSRASERYFVRFPSQIHEGTLAALIATARLLSQKRHQIAHSVVAPHYSVDDKSIPGVQTPHYAIMPPWFSARSLTKRDKPIVRPGNPPWMFVYRIRDIDGFADEFRALTTRIDRLRSDVDPEGELLFRGSLS